MIEQKQPTKKECLERFELSNKPTLFITRELKTKIDWLHSMVGNKEWSGELITEEEGNINDLDGWKITAKDIFLADVGTSGFTGYEVDKGSFKSSDIIELYDAYPELLTGKLKLQHCHTHHGLGIFFSGTDWENLEDRAAVSNYFLMLIVGFDNKWVAKVAFKAKRSGGKSVKLDFANNTDGFKAMKIEENNDKEVLVVMDCKIELESLTIDATFAERYNKVVDEKEAEKKREEEARKASYKTPQKYGNGLGTLRQGKLPYEDVGYGGYGGHNSWEGYESWEDNGHGIAVRKEKKISDMTEKEWLENETGVGKFELRHAKALINSILHSTYSPMDFSDCIKKLEAEDATLHNKGEYEEWIDQFDWSLGEHFDVLFPYKNVGDYVDLLRVMQEYLHPYKRNRLVQSILEALVAEIELNSEEINDVLEKAK